VVVEVPAITRGPRVAEEPFLVFRVSADESDAKLDQASLGRIQPSCRRVRPCRGESHGDEMSRS
jgi:hypothetical protein